MVTQWLSNDPFSGFHVTATATHSPPCWLHTYTPPSSPGLSICNFTKMGDGKIFISYCCTLWNMPWQVAAPGYSKRHHFTKTGKKRKVTFQFCTNNVSPAHLARTKNSSGLVKLCHIQHAAIITPFQNVSGHKQALAWPVVECLHISSYSSIQQNCKLHKLHNKSMARKA